MKTDTINRAKQMKHFWSSLLFGSDQKLTSIEKQTDYETSKTEILLWLEKLFSVPYHCWVLVKASKNPHSEIFILQQSDYNKIPKKIFIKKFVVHEGTSFLEGLKRECSAINEFSQYNGRYDVYTPELYAFNEHIFCMALSYVEGNSFFNVLCESPVTVAIGNSRMKYYKASLFNLGRWLQNIHNSDFALSEMDKEKKLHDLLNKDMYGINLRIEYLKKVRPADFGPDVCEKIISKSTELQEYILMKNPTLNMVHADFSLANILYEKGILYVLDFSYSGLGLPEDDLARLYLDLYNVESYSCMLTPRGKGGLTSSFLSGYGKELHMNDLSGSQTFYILKHLIINMYMYTKLWGNKGFLNPFLCRLFYGYQKKILFSLIG